MLLGVELSIVAFAFDERSVSVTRRAGLPQSLKPLELGVSMLHSLLLAAWPRAAAHSAVVTRGVLRVYMRSAALWCKEAER
ncbi:MAG: hypothetical protein SGPRY_008404, partial [Prymnesium sp.]